MFVTGKSRSHIYYGCPGHFVSTGLKRQFVIHSMMVFTQKRARQLFLVLLGIGIFVMLYYRYGWESQPHVIPRDKLKIDIDRDASLSRRLFLELQLAELEKLTPTFIQSSAENVHEDIQHSLQTYAHLRPEQHAIQPFIIYRQQQIRLEEITSTIAAPQFSLTQSDPRPQLLSIAETLTTISSSL